MPSASSAASPIGQYNNIAPTDDPPPAEAVVEIQPGELVRGRGQERLLQHRLTGEVFGGGRFKSGGQRIARIASIARIIGSTVRAGPSRSFTVSTIPSTI